MERRHAEVSTGPLSCDFRVSEEAAQTGIIFLWRLPGGALHRRGDYDGIASRRVYSRTVRKRVRQSKHRYARIKKTRRSIERRCDLLTELPHCGHFNCSTSVLSR